ncbi:predicted protein [Thalassiosira pseudonana CCMP1335]|uniref:UBA domain-containing protein n=1 Tax=Thalassiosira pseudonana TaxID=35128 RepID=B8BS73_THAPS|nr:predicted protein [Thalassiosira pseudonana CCMP1335]EED96078.1 predicted protein [Thalassiosira pseudonana CCMP1335]
MDSTVPQRAGEWINRFLATPTPSSTGAIITHPVRSFNVEGGLDLRLLNVKELKRITKELSNQICTHYLSNNIIVNPNISLAMPKSNARKADWIAVIVGCFRQPPPSSMVGVGRSAPDIYVVLEKSAISRSAAGAGSLVTSMQPMGVPVLGYHLQEGHQQLLMHHSSSEKEVSQSKIAPSTIIYDSWSSINAISTGDVTNQTKQQYMQEDLRAFMCGGRGGGASSLFGFPASVGVGNGMIGGAGSAMGSVARSSIPLASSAGVAPSFPHNRYHGTGYNAVQSSGVKRPYPSAAVAPSTQHNNANSKAKLAVKVKAEPKSPQKQPAYCSYNTNNNNYNSNSSFNNNNSSSEDDSATPRSFQEASMVESLHNMGFTDTREILNGLRAVATQHEEVSIAMSNDNNNDGGNPWVEQSQVEAAMMWIVNQREEVAEAAKLDEARINSENEKVVMERSRREDADRQLKYADLSDLIGSLDDEEGVKVTSKFYPYSTVLRNVAVRRVFTMIASCNYGKDEVIRFLKLEEKTRKWYGTVLPFSYFEYVLCPRFTQWDGDATLNSALLCQKLMQESAELEKAMYALSEQEEGGVGRVPKLLLNAQREATEAGRAICLEVEMANSDDDCEFVPMPQPNAVAGNKSTAKSRGNVKTQEEVIELS